MEIKNLLNESADQFKSMQADASRLAGKWSATGLLEGISNENEKNSMALMLENQAKELVKESANNTTSGTEAWAGVALPLVRKVFAQVAAKDFVSVQPMNLPSGLVFYLDFKYGSNSDAFASGSNMYGNVSTANDKMDLDTEAEGGLYGAGRFGYTVNGATAASTIDLVEDGSVAAIGLANVGYDDSIDRTAYDVVSVALPSDADALAARAFKLDSVAALAEYTKVASNKVFFVVPGGSYADAASATLAYHVQPTDQTRGDFEAGNTAAVDSTISIPEIEVSLASEAITAKTRKLKAQWTPEFAQDLNAYHSVDAEAELTSILSEYISMEIDLEILDMLISDARTTERWSAANNKTWDGSDWAVPTSTSQTGFYNTQGEWFQTLGTKMQKVSNKIHQKTLRGGANFVVVSPAVATILESIPGFAAATDGDKMDFAMGVQKVGSLNSRYKVYKNPYMTENTILMGYRGSQFLETGAVYAPYIPLMMTPLVYDPETFTPRKGLMTRYAKKMIRPEFYGKIFVSDLELV